MLITKTLTKKGLEIIISENFSNFGILSTSALLDSLKILGFYYSTTSGLSITIDDLKTSVEKNKIVKIIEKNVLKINQNWYQGLISDTERFQTIINSWNQATESLKNKIVDYYKKFDPTNNLYIMAFSGARGNISQVRQLIGMRGLMSDQAGKIINLPIQSSFRQGLSSIDYIISSYGARKGIVDTALKTANAGYLTRRLVYLVRDIIIKHFDCKTKNGLWIYVTNTTPIQPLLGKIILSENIFNFSKKGQIITEVLFKLLKKKVKNQVNLSFLKEGFILKIRSPLTCMLQKSICQNCYGWDLGKRKIIPLGEAIGIIAAQSIGEPGTQLTMRTFHTGGIFTNELTEQNCAPFAGRLVFPSFLKTVPCRTIEGKEILKIIQDTFVLLYNWQGDNKKIFLDAGSYLHISSSRFLKKDELIAEIPKRKVISELYNKKSVYNYFDGQIFLENKLEKNHLKEDKIIWIVSGKLYSLPLEIEYTYPIKLSIDKSLGFLKLVSPVEGIIKKTFNNIYIQQVPCLKKNGVYKKKKFKLESFYKRICDAYFIKKPEELNSYVKVKKRNKIIKLKINKEIRINFNIIKKLFSYLYLRTYFTVSSNLFFFKKDENKFPSLLKIPVNIFSKKNQKFYSLLKNFTYIDPYTILGQIFFFPSIIDEKIYKLKIIKKKKNNKINFFFITNSDIWSLSSDQTSYTFLSLAKNKNKIFQSNHYFTPTSKHLESGILLKKDGFRFLFQKAQAILLPFGTETKYKDKSFVKKNTVLSSLLNINQQTQDIVQGLPKIEELIEAISSNKRACTSEKIGLFLVNEFFYHSNAYKNKYNEFAYKSSIKSLKKNANIVDHITLIESLTSTKNFFFYDSTLCYLSFIPYIYWTEMWHNLLNSEILLNIKVDNYFEDLFFKSQDVEYEFKILIKFINENDFILNTFRTLNKKENLDVKSLKKVKFFFYKKNQFLGKKIAYYEKNFDIFYIITPLREIHSLKLNSIKNFNITKSYKLTPKEKILGSNFEKFLSFKPYENGKFYNNLEILTEGELNPKEILHNLSFSHEKRLGIRQGTIKAAQKFQLILINSIQAIYYSQGVLISNKHLEIVIREMVSRGRILISGVTPFFFREVVKLGLLNLISARLENNDFDFKNIQRPIYYPIMLSTTKGALRKEGFLSNAGFQRTKKMLLKSALRGKSDWLKGLKDCIITGRLIPSGSVFLNYKTYLDKIFKIK